MTYALRASFPGGIIAEFLPPSRQRKQIAAIILCDGMPTVPHKFKLMSYLSNRGFWVFHVRYRGSWESSGQFLAASPHLDVLNVVDGLHNKITEAWGGQTFNVKPQRTIVMGSSFGGTAALLASTDKRIDKAVAISPVVDWNAISKTEPLPKMYAFIKQGFGQGYRMRKSDWNKLGKNGFYNPVDHADNINKDKVLLVHARNDDVVSYKSVKTFSIASDTQLITLRGGGHLGTNILLQNDTINKQVMKFITS